MKKLIAGTRGSNLARKQTQTVTGLLQTIYPSLKIDIRIIKTKGDHIQDTPLAKIGGKGLFTKELEHKLLNREIDFAVHSLKDLPVELPSGLTLGAYITRELPNDVLISKGNLSLCDILPNGIIATGSLRRKFQLLRYREDLRIVDVRGNIETRIRKLYDNDWDGLILAYAALKRLGKTDLISEVIPSEIMYPAVGQGIIAVECRDQRTMHDIFSAINDKEAAICAAAERAFLQGLGGGCQIPVGIISKIVNEKIHLSGVYMPEDRKHYLKKSIVFDIEQPEVAGKKLSEKILNEYKLKNTSN